MTVAHHPVGERGGSMRRYLAQGSMLDKQTPAVLNTSDVLKRIRLDSWEPGVSADLSLVGFRDRPSLSSCPGESGGQCERGSPGPRWGRACLLADEPPGQAHTTARPRLSLQLDATWMPRPPQPQAHVPGQRPPCRPPLPSAFHSRCFPAAAELTDAKSPKLFWS